MIEFGGRKDQGEMMQLCDLKNKRKKTKKKKYEQLFQEMSI